MSNHARPFARPPLVAVMAFLLPAGGCDQRPAAPPPPPPAATTVPATEPAPPRIDPAALRPDQPTPATPGYVVGRVLGTDGKPVTMEGVRIEVQIGGFTDADLATITETVEVNRDGTYAKKLRKGRYRQPTARIEFPFRGSTYRLPLVPVGGGGSQQESADGVAQDFVWRLSGPRPGARPDKNRPDTWLGGSAVLEYHSYREDLRRVVRAPPTGTTVALTFTPTGPLADGSAGKPIEVVRSYNPTDTALVDPVAVDLPLAHYDIRGEERLPDGRRIPMLFLRPNQQWADGVAGTFEPDLAKSALRQAQIYLSRREQ